MMQRIIFGVTLIAMILPQAATAKVFREDDNSSHNTCAYVHEWFTKTERKHAVFVTLGGVDYRTHLEAKETCQAGGGPTLAGSKAYAVGWCKKIARKQHSKLECKVMQMR